MVNAWVIEKFGSVEELKIQDRPISKPKNNEVLLRQKAIGINVVDILQRQGRSKLDLPGVIGCEACGIVEEVGSDVVEFKKGDRVAYGTTSSGAYADTRIIDRKFLIPMPDYIKDEQAAAMLTKGMTAHMLLRRTFFVTKNNTVLVHNAVSGLGQLICVMAKHYGAKVIASFEGGEESKKVVKNLGVDEIIDLQEHDLQEKVDNFTKKNGVHAVFDFFGSKTFASSVECLSDFGLLVNLIDSYGEPASFDIGKLFRKSTFVTSPDLSVYKKDRGELLLSGNEVFALMQQKVIKPNIYKTYKFSEMREAHADLEKNQVLGQSIVVI